MYLLSKVGVLARMVEHRLTHLPGRGDVPRDGDRLFGSLLEDVEGVDAIIHLAGLSNDPLGELVPGLTEEINLWGTLKLAELAKETGAQRFIYSSSQSMYGISYTDSELNEDDSEKNAITAYAKTKWEAECRLMKMQSSNFKVVAFRPSTVFGASPRLRCDIVYNNLVGSAFTTGSIIKKVKSPLGRPIVYVWDVGEDFIVGLEVTSEYNLLVCCIN